MKTGDLVIRKAEPWDSWSIQQNENDGFGIVIGREQQILASRAKTTAILTVYYSKSCRVGTIAETLVENFDEKR